MYYIGVPSIKSYQILHEIGENSVLIGVTVSSNEYQCVVFFRAVSEKSVY